MLSWDFAVRPKKKREFKMGLDLTLRQFLKKIKERSLLITLKRDFAMSANANLLRVKVKEKEKTVEELYQALVNLERSKKNVEF